MRWKDLRKGDVLHYKSWRSGDVTHTYLVVSDVVPFAEAEVQFTVLLLDDGVTYVDERLADQSIPVAYFTIEQPRRIL